MSTFVAVRLRKDVPPVFLEFFVFLNFLANRLLHNRQAGTYD